MSKIECFGEIPEIITLSGAEMESGNILKITAQDGKVYKGALSNAEENRCGEVCRVQRNQSAIQYNSLNQVSKGPYFYGPELYCHEPKKHGEEAFGE